MGTASGQVQQSVASAWLYMPQMVANFLQNSRVMPNLPHTLIDVGEICDADSNVLSGNHAVIVTYFLDGVNSMALDCGSLHFSPNQYKPPAELPNSTSIILRAFSTYNLPSAASLVRYIATVFPVKFTYILTIIAGNYAM